MNKEYRYGLEKGSKKHHCPKCGKKTFVGYVDNETGEYLPLDFGRCDRENNCGYFLNPYSSGYGTKNQNFIFPKPQPKKIIPHRTPDPVYFDFDTFKKTLKNYDQNIFIQNLLRNVPFPFEAEQINQIISLYYLGTVSSGYLSGAITFPFIDENNNIRTVQVKTFNENNSTRQTDFLHSIIEKNYTYKNKPVPKWLADYVAQDKRVTCLFGAHLLSQYPNNPIALVEAPKTAIYGNLYFGVPKTDTDLIWLAVYNKSSFTFDKVKVLRGRKVIVFPDLGAFDKWQGEAKDYEKQLPNTKFIFSRLLEDYATNKQREDGADIADVLIKLDWRKFKKQTNNVETKEENKTVPAVEVKTKEKIKAVEPVPHIEAKEKEKLFKNLDRAVSNKRDHLLIQEIINTTRLDAPEAIELFKEFKNILQ